jgi:hypothetical protein
VAQESARFVRIQAATRPLSDTVNARPNLELTSCGAFQVLPACAGVKATSPTDMLVTATIAINLLDMTNPPSHRAGWSPTHSPSRR